MDPNAPYQQMSSNPEQGYQAGVGETNAPLYAQPTAQPVYQQPTAQPVYQQPGQPMYQPPIVVGQPQPMVAPVVVPTDPYVENRRKNRIRVIIGVSVLVGLGLIAFIIRWVVCGGISYCYYYY